MAIISHANAVSLEEIMCDAYKQPRRFSVCGLANADFLEHSPLSAAVAVLAPLSLKYSDEDLVDVADFWGNYRCEFSHDGENPTEELTAQFIEDLRTLSEKYYK